MNMRKTICLPPSVMLNFLDENKILKTFLSTLIPLLQWFQRGRLNCGTGELPSRKRYRDYYWERCKIVKSVTLEGNILNVSDDACQVRYDLNLTQWCLRFYNLEQFTVFDSFSHPLPTMLMFVYFL